MVTPVLREPEVHTEVAYLENKTSFYMGLVSSAFYFVTLSISFELLGPAVPLFSFMVSFNILHPKWKEKIYSNE